MPLMMFDKAIVDSAPSAKFRLLPGDGFSVGCRVDVAQYVFLFTQTGSSKTPLLTLPSAASTMVSHAP